MNNLFTSIGKFELDFVANFSRTWFENFSALPLPGFMRAYVKYTISFPSRTGFIAKRNKTAA